MRADVVKVCNLFDTTNQAYVIPLYQRPFAWSDEKATELLDSIKEDCDNNESMTSLGSVLFCQIDTRAPNDNPFGNNMASSIAPNVLYEVVDGQQRLTVFTMIGYVLKKKYDDLISQGLNYSPSTELELFYSTAKRTTGQRVPNLIRDEDNFDSGINSDVSKLLECFINTQPLPPTLSAALLSVYGEIISWVDTNLNATNFEEFTEYFLEKSKIIQVDADDQNTAFNMFEPLNSTSEPLTAFEVFKSKVTRNIQPFPGFPNSDKLIDYNNSQRDSVIRKSNDLVFYTAQYFSGKRPSKKFVNLKKYLDQNVNSTFVSSLEIFAEFYDSVWLKVDNQQTWFNEEDRNCVKFLKASKHDVCIPLLSRYYEYNSNLLPEVLKVVVAFYSLWRSNFPTQKLPETYRNLFTHSNPDNMSINGGVIKTVQQLKDYFRGKLEARITSEFGTSGSYFDRWKVCQSLSYESLSTICRLFVFVDIGQSVRCNFINSDPWTNTDDIEHIASVDLHQGYSNLHNIGNLTFLPPSINRSIKNIAWPDKKEIFDLLSVPTISTPPNSLTSGITTPQAVLDYLQDRTKPALVHLGFVASETNWTESEINARSEMVKRSAWDVLYNNYLC